jgi:hypothetical protein
MQIVAFQHCIGFRPKPYFEIRTDDIMLVPDQDQLWPISFATSSYVHTLLCFYKEGNYYLLEKTRFMLKPRNFELQNFKSQIEEIKMYLDLPKRSILT